jgi:hypothetical protein
MKLPENFRALLADADFRLEQIIDTGADCSILEAVAAAERPR